MTMAQECARIYDDALLDYRGRNYAAALKKIRAVHKRLGGFALKSMLLKAYIERDAGRPISEIGTLEVLLANFEKEHGSDDIISSAWSLLGAVCSRLGRNDEARGFFLKAAERDGRREQKLIEYSNAIFTTNCSASVSPEELRELFAIYRATLPKSPRLAPRDYAHDRIRVGYVSGDFRKHPVAYFVYALLKNFDPRRFDVYCYAVGQHDDEMTGRLKRLPVVWRDIPEGDFENAARVIRDDEIDILVDLTGHTAGNVLGIMAYRPAPVQLSAIGYMGSTGLFSVDGFLSDVYCSTEKESPYFTEKLIRLPRTHLCYTRPYDFPPLPDSPPCVRNGFITFGCFNNFSKITEEALSLWGKIMKNVPGSRLILKHKIFGSRQGRYFARLSMEAAGVPVERVEMRPYNDRYLFEYGDIDVAFDTFPYNGGLTTCEALYMGAPVITLAGDRHGSRFGFSLLKNVGLDALIAKSGEEYARIAKALADDTAVICALRKNLRRMIAQSPVMDGVEYTREVEAVYEKLCGR